MKSSDPATPPQNLECAQVPCNRKIDKIAWEGEHSLISGIWGDYYATQQGLMSESEL